MSSDLIEEVRSVDHSYFDTLIQRYPLEDEYLDEVTINIINESINMYEAHKVFIQNEIKYSSQINDLLNKENKKKMAEQEKKQRNDEILKQERLNMFNTFFRYLNYVEMDSDTLSDIKISIKNFCELKEYSIKLNDKAFIELINFIDSRKHRLSDKVIQYIKDNMINEDYQSDNEEFEEDFEYEYNEE